MSWWVIEATLEADHDSEVIARALVEATGQAVEERGSTVLAYAASESDARRVANTILQAHPNCSIRTQPADALDWTSQWREGYAVRQVGRLRIGPSWLLDRSEASALVIDPEMAFGTGEHGSTRGALALIDRFLSPGGTVLDLGSGTGILAIGAVKLGAGRALGIEIDPEALPIAEANAIRNGVADRVSFLEGDAAVLAPLLGPASLVVSNILRTVNVDLLPAIRSALAAGGTAVFSGMEVPESPLFLPSLENAGFRVLDTVVDDGWWSAAARRA